ncbi:hypothetical protein, partial [Flavonifractor hominis]
RTQKLSSPAPTILAWRRAGKIGNANTKDGLLLKSVFCYFQFYLNNQGLIQVLYVKTGVD